ncbi:MAG TPA: hypothetical protein VM571_08130 [Noviherbaspirillum sp.]|nr:hypothetical protein [Noviherbaspirillum sp.]
MTSTTSSSLLATACHRPKKLYRYSLRQWLERALQLGEFRLRPPVVQADMPAGEQILPFGRRADAATTNYLTLSMTNVWDDKLFDAFAGADCCLVIHDPEQFGERIHRAAQRLLPSWAGIDAAVSYGIPSPLGAVFSKDRHYATEKEWMFAWRPTQAALVCNPVMIHIGSIESIAELRQKGE